MKLNREVKIEELYGKSSRIWQLFVKYEAHIGILLMDFTLWYETYIDAREEILVTSEYLSKEGRISQYDTLYATGIAYRQNRDLPDWPNCIRLSFTSAFRKLPSGQGSWNNTHWQIKIEYTVGTIVSRVKLTSAVCHALWYGKSGVTQVES